MTVIEYNMYLSCVSLSLLPHFLYAAKVTPANPRRDAMTGLKRAAEKAPKVPTPTINVFVHEFALEISFLHKLE